jgi:beta-lactamase regulating signal transducer with metallopeptidase domain
VTHFLDAVLGPGLWLLGDWSLRWAVLIAALAIGVRLLRPRRPATRALLGTSVLLAGLLLPLLPRWGPGVAPEPVVPESVPAPRPAALPAAPAEPRPRPSAIAKRRHSPPATVETSDPPTRPGPTWEMHHFVTIGLGGLWAAGALFLLARWGGGWLFLRRLVRSAEPVQGPCAALFAACKAELGLRRRATLATHAQVRSPITLGLFRPIVLVPAGWADLAAPMQRGALLHELAHVARRDAWWALLLELVRVVFWFHPLVRWLLARLEQERELLCDEVAVGRGVDPHDLAQLLLAFAGHPGRLGLALAFGKRRTVKVRIHHLLEENMERRIRPLGARWALAVGALVVGLALLVGSLRVAALEAEGLPNAPPGADEPGKAARGGEKAVVPGARAKKEALRYGGKSFAQWRTEVTTELKSEPRSEGLKAMAAFGANGYAAEATAVIVEVMRGYECPDVAMALGVMLLDGPGAPLGGVGAGMGGLGASPGILPALDRDDARVIRAALEAVRKIGHGAVPTLAASLQDESARARRFAIVSLKMMAAPLLDDPRDGVRLEGPENAHLRPAVPALLKALNDRDPVVQTTAIALMIDVAPSNKGLVPALIKVLNVKNREVRFDAVSALGNLGPRAKAAVPALRELLKEAEAEGGGEEIRNALGSIGRRERSP